MDHRSAGSKSALEAPVRWSNDVIWQWELDAVAMELLGGNSLALLRGDFGHLDDLNVFVASSVHGSHVVIKFGDCCNPGEISEFFVQIGGPALPVSVPQKDSKILYLHRFLLENLIHRQYFTLCLLDFLQLVHEVPESALCVNVIL